MLNEAAQRFPELNNNELIRLVDRDWAYMSEEDRAVHFGLSSASSRNILSVPAKNN